MAISFSMERRTPVHHGRHWCGIVITGNLQKIADLFSLRTPAAWCRGGAEIPSFA